jgi:carbon monoxide dehydrogenase subunit G
MELEHSFTVPVPAGRAWDVLLDVERVAPCMPGATLDSVNGDEITGRIKVKVGPISMTYAGTAKFTERDRDAGVVVLKASGKETRGAGTASASVRSELTPDGDQTHVTVHTSLNVTGKPAQFGRGVMTEVGGKLIGIFAGNLAAMLAAEPDPSAEDADDEDAQDLAGNAAEPGAGVPDEALPIDVLNLPTRAWSSLRKDGIQTLGDLVRRTPEQLLAIGNIGPASMAEINRRLADRGLALTGPESSGPESSGPASSGPASSGPESSGPAAAAGPASSSDGTAQPAAAGPASSSDGTAQPAAAARASSSDGTAQPAAAHSAAAPQSAAERAAANGAATPVPREPVGWQPQDDAIDLLGVAGLPVLKRAVPAAAGLLALILVFFGLRRRRARRG